MIDVAEVNAAVFVLLMRARKAWEKAERMADLGHTVECARLTAKAVELRRDADMLDPGHECAAWADHLNGTHGN
jgi:hypothetical protein